MLTWAFIAVGLYICVVAAAFLVQRKLIFPAPGSQAPLPSGFEAVSYRTDDGISLKAGYRPAVGDKPTVVFFHGNGDNWRGAGVATARLAAAGYGVLLPEYRGYAGSPGSPSEAGLYSDGRAALGWLSRQGIAPSRLAIVGNSIGSGVAVELATEIHPAALVLISPFATLPDVAAHHIPWLPTRLLMRDRFDNLAKIGGVNAPILIMHGRSDKTIPFDHAERLLREAPHAQLVPFADAGHQLGYSDEAGDAEVEWLNGIFGLR